MTNWSTASPGLVGASSVGPPTGSVPVAAPVVGGTAVTGPVPVAAPVVGGTAVTGPAEVVAVTEDEVVTVVDAVMGGASANSTSSLSPDGRVMMPAVSAAISSTAAATPSRRRPGSRRAATGGIVGRSP